MAESNDTTRSLETSTEVLLELLLSPLPDLPNGRIDPSVLTRIKAIHTNDIQLVREIMPILSIDRILEKSIDSESLTMSIAYLGLLVNVTTLPEYTHCILKRTDFWLRLNEKVTTTSNVVPETMFNLFFQRSALISIAHLTPLVKARDFHLLIEGHIMESMVIIVEKTPEYRMEDSLRQFKETVMIMGFNYQCNEVYMTYLEECGAFRYIDKSEMIIGTEMHGFRNEYIKTSQNVTCHKCGKAENEQKFKTCNRCHSAFYCSKKCQRSDWKKHKKTCRKWSKNSKKAK